MQDFARARVVLEQAVAKQDIPGVVALVGNQTKNLWLCALGETEYDGTKVSSDTYYDLASLTKVVSTLPAILKLVSENELSLDDEVGKFIHNAGWFQTPSLANVSIRQLLTHSSGLAAWKPLFAWVSERQTAIANVLQSEISHEAGSFVYSDLGFMTLGVIIERISKMKQDAFVKQHIFEPLGMSKIQYGPLASANVAATEDCPWRNQILKGIVHDENAFCLEHVAGHAGLFGVAEDLALYARAWLNFDTNLAKEEVLQAALKEYVNQAGVRRGLGWALKGNNSFAGSAASLEGYGHTGFTGTSLWIEPKQNWFAILLSNRVHPSRKCGSKIHNIRQTFHTAIAKEFS